MLTSLRITGFRNFSSLLMEGLTRVNLLVGENNAGKTSVLEALEILLLLDARTAVLTNGPIRRGENIVRPQPDKHGHSAVIDLRHLFHGREGTYGDRFEIQGLSSTGTVTANCELVRMQRLRSSKHPASNQDEIDRAPLGIMVSTPSNPKRKKLFPLEFSIETTQPFLGDSSEVSQPAVQFVETATPQTQSLIALWNELVLNPEEKSVVEAIQIIEPGVERIASLSPSTNSAGGIVVKLQHSDRRVPLGSMGEGIRRLFVLAMNLVTSANGYLLVDEIDTGLHYSVMVKMWKLAVETARRLNIQVFATSHSLDCIQALAALYEREPDVRDDISLHRLEKSAQASIRYSADEILSAAQRQVEVR